MCCVSVSIVYCIFVFVPCFMELCFVCYVYQLILFSVFFFFSCILFCDVTFLCYVYKLVF